MPTPSSLPPFPPVESAGCHSGSEFGPRLITLSDGRPGLRTTMQVEIHDPPSAEIQNPESSIQDPVSGTQHPDAPILDFIASDESLDRYGEVISAIGWELDSYQRNPVFQNAHQYGDIIFTLGRALITEVRSLSPFSSLPSPCLFQRIQFATDVNPMAKIAYGLYRGKFLSAVSVGFIPAAWEDGTQETPYRRKYLSQELLEVSAVAIPANPNALALGLKSGAIEKSDLRDLADLVRLALDRPGAAADSPSPGGEGRGEGGLPASTARLFNFARTLHAIIRS